MSGVKQRLGDLAYATGWGVVGALPKSVSRAGFNAGAGLGYRRNGQGTRQLRKNYARVVPQAGPEELDELTRAGLRSYARYWLDTFRIPRLNPRDIYRQVDELMVGSQLMDAALDRGKGLILALPHTANFDVSGIWIVGHCGAFTTVAERLQSDYLFGRFRHYRESLGFEILPSKGGPVTPYRVLMERLQQNKVICLPADRDLSRRGVPVDFFGEKTRMPAGPARLAAVTGAQILIVDNLFTEDGWNMRLHSPMLVHGREEVPAATQKMADLFAADIAASPADWHMMQKLWLADLPADHRTSLRQADASAEAAE